MRLLNAKNLKFKDFPESNLPRYAILSHTWEEGHEVSLQEMASPYLTEKKGYDKITHTCDLARARGLEWVWIDTCCIDKTNNTELTESINSMFRWYKLAEICYVYLADFSITGLAEDPKTVESGDLLSAHDTDQMQKCRWFYRGWTLQELLAPHFVVFYDAAWQMIGGKDRLTRLVAQITEISKSAILGEIDLSYYSIAQRMAWASTRETTRDEDAAYCLLGIFEVNMPLIYGEGHRAFERLQEEILKKGMDFTLFGWSPAQAPDGPKQPTNLEQRGMQLFASSPKEFRNCHDLEQFRNDDSEIGITSRGVRLRSYLVLIPTEIDHGLGGPVQNTLDQHELNRQHTLLQAHTPTHSMDRPLAHRGATVPGASPAAMHTPTFSHPPHLAELGHSSSDPAIGSHRSDLSSPASQKPRFTRYRYVLPVGRTRSKTQNSMREIGVKLRKTGDGQFIRENSPDVQKMTLGELRDDLNTTEPHFFYITLRPSRPVASAQPGTTTRDSIYRSGQLPARSSPGLSSSAYGAPPTASTALPKAYHFRDLSWQHPLRTFYSTRLLRGIHIPSLIDRNINYGHIMHSPFDERLRIYCQPESQSEVVGISCKSKQGSGKYPDTLQFGVLIDLRRSSSSDQAVRLVERTSLEAKLLFALVQNNQSEMVRWHLIESELAPLMSASNKLHMTTGKHTYEIVATLKNGLVAIDEYTMHMRTLDIQISNITQGT